jgi:hypothetical protein
VDWLTQHRRSEEFAARAHELLRHGDGSGAEASFRQAADAEEQALSLIDESKPRTLGIAAVSAVSLWYKGKDFDRASVLAHRCLARLAIVGGARDQLDDLLLTLYNERDKQRMSSQFLPGSVTVSVRGGEVLRGAAPLELIVEKVRTLQSIFFRVVEWQSKKPLRTRGGPTSDVCSSFEPWLVQEAPGSFQFSVAVKVNGQMDLFKAERLEAADIAKKFLDVVMTIATDTTGQASKELIPEDDYRGTFRKLIRNLTPTRGTFESMVISSKDRDGTFVALDDSTRPRLASVLKAEQAKPDDAAGETPAEFTGVLRALDLDKDWLKVEGNDGQQVEVKKLSQAVDDLIGPMVNKRVTVRAIKTQKGELRFSDIELSED